MTNPGNLAGSLPRGEDWIAREIADIKRRLRHLRAGGSVVTGLQLDDTCTSITSTSAGTGTSQAQSTESIAIGDAAVVDVDTYSGIAIGRASYAHSGDDGANIAIGSGADATGQFGAVAIGDNAHTNADSSIALGPSAATTGTNSVAIGLRAEGAGGGAVAIGCDQYGDPAVASGDGSIAIGGDARAVAGSGTPPLPGDTSAIAIGLDSSANARSIAIGTGSSAGVAGVTVAIPTAWSGDPGQTAIGADTIISAPYSTSLGYGTQSGDYGISAAGAYSTTLGAKTAAKKDGSVAIGADHTGAGALSNVQDEIRLGTANHITVIAGKLVIADASGGLHQIVVSTGGALSTVAYP